MESKNKVSVVIPVFNEKESIGEVVDEIKDVLNDNNIEYEILIVDDGSTDDTSKILKTKRDIKIVTHPYRLGYGTAVQNGIKLAKYDLIALTDGDGTYPIKSLPDLISKIERYDMVIGARRGKWYKGSLLKRIGRCILNLFVSYITGTDVPDANSGFRIFKKVISQRFNILLSPRFSYSTSLTIATICGRCLVKFVPIEYFQRLSRSKVHRIRDSLGTLQVLIQLSLFFDPLKVVLPFCVFFLFIALGSFLAYLFFYELELLVVITVSLSSSVIIFVLGGITYLLGLQLRLNR